MKNDLFFMATAILNVWKLGSCKDYCVGVLADKDNEDYKIFVLDNQKDQLELILDIFGDSSIEHKDATIYLTKTPSNLFVKAARQRQISKIYFIQTQGDFLIDAMDKDFLIPFTYSFGAIIDILSQFKPIEKVKA